MGKTLGPPQVSEETSTWWGNLPYPKPPGGRNLCGCCGEPLTADSAEPDTRRINQALK